MSMLEPRSHDALDEGAVRQLEAFVRTRDPEVTTGPHTITLDGESVTIPLSVYAAVLDILIRFGRGDGVVIGSTDALLTTSQAAKLIGISATYLLRLLDTGAIPVQYRGTHRRIRLADATAYLVRRSTPSP